jgi:hypothetical protein
MISEGFEMRDDEYGIIYVSERKADGLPMETGNLLVNAYFKYAVNSRYEPAFDCWTIAAPGDDPGGMICLGQRGLDITPQYGNVTVEQYFEDWEKFADMTVSFSAGVYVDKETYVCTMNVRFPDIYTMTNDKVNFKNFYLSSRVFIEVGCTKGIGVYMRVGALPSTFITLIYARAWWGDGEPSLWVPETKAENQSKSLRYMYRIRDQIIQGVFASDVNVLFCINTAVPMRESEDPDIFLSEETMLTLGDNVYRLLTDGFEYSISVCDTHVALTVNITAIGRQREPGLTPLLYVDSMIIDCMLRNIEYTEKSESTEEEKTDE